MKVHLENAFIYLQFYLNHITLVKLATDSTITADYASNFEHCFQLLHRAIFLLLKRDNKAVRGAH